MTNRTDLARKIGRDKYRKTGRADTLSASELTRRINAYHGSVSPAAREARATASPTAPRAGMLRRLAERVGIVRPRVAPPTVAQLYSRPTAPIAAPTVAAPRTVTAGAEPRLGAPRTATPAAPSARLATLHAAIDTQHADALADALTAAGLEAQVHAARLYVSSRHRGGAVRADALTRELRAIARAHGGTQLLAVV